MAKNTRKYEVRFAGKVIDTRTSQSRDYTHAVVVKNSESYHWNRAYNRAGNPYWQSGDRSNFDYATRRASQTPGVPFTVHVTGCVRPWSYEDTISAEEHAAACAEIEGGFGAYIERKRQVEIAKFEERKAAGVFEAYGVIGYCSRRDLAEKLAAKERAHPWHDDVQIVEVTKL